MASCLEHSSTRVLDAMLPSSRHALMFCLTADLEVYLQFKENVELTASVVGTYIAEAVTDRLAFDIPASWHLFMVCCLPSDARHVSQHIASWELVIVATLS